MESKDYYKLQTKLSLDTIVAKFECKNNKYSELG